MTVPPLYRERGSGLRFTNIQRTEVFHRRPCAGEAGHFDHGGQAEAVPHQGAQQVLPVNRPPARWQVLGGAAVVVGDVQHWMRPFSSLTHSL